MNDEVKSYTLRLTDKALEDVMYALDQFGIKNPGQILTGDSCHDAYEQLGEQKTARDMGR